MEKYTFISLYYLHILPTHQILCLNQYFLILGNKCSIKSLLEYFTVVLCLFVFSMKGEFRSHHFNNYHLEKYEMLKSKGWLESMSCTCVCMVSNYSKKILFSTDELQLACSVCIFILL